MDKFIIGFASGVLTLFLIIVFLITPDEIWHEHIVKEGHGEYNRATGKFQFLPPCSIKLPHSTDYNDTIRI